MRAGLIELAGTECAWCQHMALIDNLHIFNALAKLLLLGAHGVTGDEVVG